MTQKTELGLSGVMARLRSILVKNTANVAACVTVADSVLTTITIADAAGATITIADAPGTTITIDDTRC